MHLLKVNVSRKRSSNEDIKNATKQRDQHHKPKNWTEYKYWRNKGTNLIRSAKKEFSSRPRAENKDNAFLWKHIENLYYILNKEIQEFLVKIKVLFLRRLDIFISSREISLCRLDTFPTMVLNRPVMYNRVPAFGLL